MDTCSVVAMVTFSCVAVVVGLVGCGSLVVATVAGGGGFRITEAGGRGRDGSLVPLIDRGRGVTMATGVALATGG